jgi:hypothetical protein
MNNQSHLIQQLELPITQPARRIVLRRQSLVRPIRAHWWFSQMRAAVDQSTAALPPPRSASAGV